jgi:hypothetical protein
VVPPPLPGVTAKGLPFASRGGVGLETSALLLPQTHVSVALFDVVLHIPVLPRTFIDADLPIGAAFVGQGDTTFGGGGVAIGNIMAGMHHVFRPSERLWLSLGGAFGFPLLNREGFQNVAVGKGFWDLEMYADRRVPLALRMGLEGHVGILEVRAELDPVLAISIAPSSAPPQYQGGPPGPTGDISHVFAILHAVELQLGHAIGGGIRYQGVLIATDNTSFGSDQDKYQGAFEPFFRVYHDPAFFRLGLFLPVDTPLGAAFDKSWGVRLTTGVSLD